MPTSAVCIPSPPLQESLGYKGFFWMVIVCCIATVVVTFLADRKIDPEYGKK